jgi:hypothetical protein
MPGVELISANVSRTDQTDALRHHPRNLLTDPLDVSQAILTFAPGEESADAPNAIPKDGTRIMDAKGSGTGRLGGAAYH